MNAKFTRGEIPGSSCSSTRRSFQNRRHLESDKDEQQRVKDLVDQFPKCIQVLPSRIAHRESASMIADQRRSGGLVHLNNDSAMVLMRRSTHQGLPHRLESRPG
jgi:hypothetical protein